MPTLVSVTQRALSVTQRALSVTQRALSATPRSHRCVVTKSGYTADEDFSSADAVFNYIGDKGDEQFSLDDLRLNSPLWPGCGSSEDGEVGEEEFCLYSMDDSMDEGSEGSK
jgi:hypothetical protein